MTTKLQALLDEYSVSPEEEERILRSAFSSLTPPVLKQMPARLKRKVIVMKSISAVFASGVDYTEQQVNMILVDVHEDYVTLRRYLVDFGFLLRTTDGSRYWLNGDNSMDNVILRA